MLASLTAVVHSPENKCPLVDRSGVSADQAPQGRSANWSLSAVEPVSAPPKWKLKNGDQRPEPETRAQRTEIPGIGRQRPEPASLTRANVADSHTPGNNTPETRLRGCPERIRTLESRDAAGPWQSLDRKRWGDWRLIFITERSGLPVVTVAVPR
jgi:hypothetical protein